jgi:peptide/nickel transport system ATP-binding protein/oligopeptide transport system ATP-binding protein
MGLRIDFSSDWQEFRQGPLSFHTNPPKATPMSLLEIRGLATHFFTSAGVARAVDGVDLTLDRGQTVAVVGESGCGKTVLALSVLRLVQDPPGRIVAGSVRFDGADLLGLSEDAMRAMRGRRISMIFQEPMTALNPVFTVGEQVAEMLVLHRGMGKREARDAAGEILDLVRIPDAAQRLGSYPHELSGGMRQRIVIAMALACDPDLVLADEPTTALDVTIQAQILDLLLDLRQRKNAAVLLITHDLGIVAQTCARAMVMYAGQAVEESDTPGLFAQPLHPYTRGLLASLPKLTRRGARLTPIPGIVPSLTALPPGCSFHPRCPRAFDRCRAERPPLFARDGRQVRCWLYA